MTYKTVSVPEETYNKLKEMAKSVVDVPISTAKTLTLVTNTYEKNMKSNEKYPLYKPRKD